MKIQNENARNPLVYLLLHSENEISIFLQWVASHVFAIGINIMRKIVQERFFGSN